MTQLLSASHPQQPRVRPATTSPTSNPHHYKQPPAAHKRRQPPNRLTNKCNNHTSTSPASTTREPAAQTTRQRHARGQRRPAPNKRPASTKRPAPNKRLPNKRQPPPNNDANDNDAPTTVERRTAPTLQRLANDGQRPRKTTTTHPTAPEPQTTQRASRAMRRGNYATQIGGGRRR